MMGWLYLIVSGIFVFMLYAFWLRVVAGYMGVPRDNQAHQWLIEKTNLLLAPLHWKMTISRVEVPCLVVILVLELIQQYVLSGIFFGIWFPLYKLPFLVIGDSLIYILNILFFAMILRIILGWVTHHTTSPLREMTHTLTEPFIKYSREMIPVTGGFDVSPLVWLIFFKVIAFIIFASLAVFMR